MASEEKINHILQLHSIKEQKALTKALSDILEALRGLQFPQPPSKLELAGAEMVTIKGQQGDRGDKGDAGEPGPQGPKGERGPQGEKGEVGPKGDTPVAGIDFDLPEDGRDGAPGRDGSPDTGAQIIEKINSSEEQIDAARISGLPEPKTYQLFGGGGGRPRVYYCDLTSQCNGAVKTFNVPLNFGIIGVFSTQAPIIYRPQIDWREGNRTLTLTSQVDAPQAGQTLWCQYLR